MSAFFYFCLYVDFIILHTAFSFVTVHLYKNDFITVQNFIIFILAQQH